MARLQTFTTNELPGKTYNAKDLVHGWASGKDSLMEACQVALMDLEKRANEREYDAVIGMQFIHTQWEAQPSYSSTRTKTVWDALAYGTGIIFTEEGNR